MPAFATPVQVGFLISGSLNSSRLVALARPTGALATALAVAAVCVVFVVGTPIVARAVQRSLGKPTRSERQRTLAEPARRFTATLLGTIGLVIAVGILSPSSLEPFPARLVEFLPRLLIAVMLMLVGSTVATLASGGVGMAVARSTGKPQPAIARLTRLVVVALVTLLAISQLGVNTKVLDTLTGAAVYGVVGAIALLTVLGGKDMAANLSAGRYVRRIVAPGDDIDHEHGTGTVLELHAATVELAAEAGWTVHVPNRILLESTLRVRRSDTDSSAG